MNVYTAQEWQIKFKEQAGKDKQLLHDLECMGLVKAEEAQKLEVDWKSLDDACKNLNQDKEWLKAKIEAANKILDLADFEDLTGAHKIHWSNWQALRHVLSNSQEQVLIPRKEPGETKP
jgi:hypothetical protein